MLDVVQIPYNPLLKATLIFSSLNDNETLYLFCVYMMNNVSQPE